MSESNWRKLDYRLSHTIAHFLNHEGSTRKFFQYITISGTAFAWWLGLTIAYFAAPLLRDEVISMFIVNTIMTILVYMIKLSVKRPRPEFRDDRMATVSFDIYSFPSGHATRSAYVSFLMPVYFPSLTVFWFLWAFIMILSRLVLGVHFISDLIVGLLLGSLAIGLMYLTGLLPIFPFLL